MDQEMNKPFMLVLSVSRNEALSAVFPHAMIETGVFPMDHDNEAMHAFIVNKMTNMTCDAMKTYFMVTSKIQDGICRLVEGNCKCDTTGKEHFWFLMFQRPSNCNIAIAFAAACQQCLHWIPPLVVSFGCAHPTNSSTTSQILCVSHSRTITTTNSSTRPIPSFLQMHVEPSSSVSNLVLLRNIVSPTLCAKKWMVNGIVPSPFPCQMILLILSPFKTQALMNIWMPPKFRTVFQWI